MWIVLAVETLLGGVSRLLWWVVGPFRRFAAHHHDQVAAEYEQLAARMQAMGRSSVASELRQVAAARREQARRLWHSPRSMW